MNKMLTWNKAVACVLKDIETEPKILCFVHPPPFNDFQIPKGTVEENEDFEKAVLRELFEESGIEKAEIVSKIGTLKRICPGGKNRDLPNELHFWHIYHIEATEKLKNNWSHFVTGGGVDDGMEYKYFWHTLNDMNTKNFDEVFIRVFKKVNLYLKKLK